MVQDNTKKDFICIYKNTQNGKHGSRINIKAGILIDICNNNNFNCYHIEQYIANKEKFKNRIILSSNIISSPVTLLTQQNIVHNIKFIHTNF